MGSRSNEPSGYIPEPRPGGRAAERGTLPETPPTPRKIGWTLGNDCPYRWQRCGRAGANCVAIYGATGQSYTLAGSDIAHTIRVRETASNAAGGGAPASSAPSGLVTVSDAVRARGLAAASPALCNGACRLPVKQVDTEVTLTITNLRPNTTYYYAIAALDNVTGRTGPRSQAVKAKTASPKRALVGPTWRYSSAVSQDCGELVERSGAGALGSIELTGVEQRAELEMGGDPLPLQLPAQRPYLGREASGA